MESIKTCAARVQGRHTPARQARPAAVWSRARSARLPERVHGPHGRRAHVLAQAAQLGAPRGAAREHKLLCVRPGGRAAQHRARQRLHARLLRGLLRRRATPSAMLQTKFKLLLLVNVTCIAEVLLMRRRHRENLKTLANAQNKGFVTHGLVSVLGAGTTAGTRVTQPLLQRLRSSRRCARACRCANRSKRVCSVCSASAQAAAITSAAAAPKPSSAAPAASSAAACPAQNAARRGAWARSRRCRRRPRSAQHSSCSARMWRCPWRDTQAQPAGLHLPGLRVEQARSAAGGATWTTRLPSSCARAAAILPSRTARHQTRKRFQALKPRKNGRARSCAKAAASASQRCSVVNSAAMPGRASVKPRALTVYTSAGSRSA